MKHKQSVKFNMGFDEALRRFAQTPASAIARTVAPTEIESKEEVCKKMAIEFLRSAPSKKGGAGKARLVKKV